MFLGTEDVLKMQFMNDIKIRYTMDFNEDNLTDLNNTLEKAEKDNEVKIQNEINYFSCDLSLFFMDGKFIVPDFTKMSWSKMEQYSVDLSVITLEDYNRICKAKEELSDNQVLLMTKIDIGSRKELNIGDETYQLKLMDNRNAFMKGKNRSAKTEMFLVTKDKKAALRLVKQIDSNLKEIGTEKVLLDLDGNNKDCESFISAIKSHYKKELKSGDMKMDDIYSGRITGYALYGGLLFMGVFFTIVFLCATVLIIYFKQISEGFDDKERFDTLKKVGMDDFEVKKTINKQVLIVFFLPLFGALLHVAIATRMIIKMLEVLWLYNHEITVMCVTASCIIFSIAYIIVYRLTAKTYYRIVMN
jgi:putative ABC transport system permease protein